MGEHLYMQVETETVMTESSWINALGSKEFTSYVFDGSLVEVVEDGQGWYTEI